MFKKEHKSAPPARSRYGRQIILNFDTLNSDTPKLLKEKWDRQNPPELCQIITVKPGDSSRIKKEFAVLNTLGPNDRLYEIFHGNIEQGGFYATSDKGTHFDSLEKHAEFLDSYLNKKLLTSKPGKTLSINLIGCYAGASKKNSNPFTSDGAEFQETLHQKGIYVQVVARKYAVGVFVEDDKDKAKKKIYKQTEVGECLHKRKGSKIVFSIDEKGRQIAEDAYAVSWKNKVLENILYCAKNTGNKSKSEKLIVLHNEFTDEKPNYILEKIQEIYTMKDSFLDLRSKPDFWKTTHTRIIFEGLIKEGKDILDNPLTIHTQMQTL